jgi:hypothetical protein
MTNIKVNHKALDLLEMDETLLNPVPPKTDKRKKFLLINIFIFYLLSVMFLIISGVFLGTAIAENQGNLFLFNLIINIFLDFIILMAITIKSVIKTMNYEM